LQPGRWRMEYPALTGSERCFDIVQHDQRPINARLHTALILMQSLI
jgi:hypothetical protein